jgi:hypothetical protein
MTKTKPTTTVDVEGNPIDDDFDYEAAAAHMASDDLEPGEWRDGTPIRRIAAAAEAVERAKAFLVSEVRAARAAGHSWTAVAAALDITRQAAQQRFAEPSDTVASA